MNINKEKQYLVIGNVKRDNNLQKYLEKICQDENIQIIEEYVPQGFWIYTEEKPSLYSKFNANPNSDILLCSYNKEKLEYINYLYEIYKKSYIYTKKLELEIYNKVNNEDKINKSETMEDSTRSELNSHNDIFDIWTDSYKNLCKIKKINQSSVPVQYVKFTVELPKDKTKFEKFKDKIIKIFNKYKKEINGFIYGVLFINITIWTVLTLKHFMIK